MLGRVEDCEQDHLWALGGFDLQLGGASAWWVCQLCGAVMSQLSERPDYWADTLAAKDRDEGTT